MNKREFMSNFKEQLKGIPENDQREILYDYEEHFEMGLNEGRTEEEIAKSLGNPKALAKEMRANYLITKAEENNSFSNFMRALFATVGLGFFNLVFVLGPFIGVAAALFAIFVSGLAIIFSGVFIIFAPYISYYEAVPNPIVSLFIGLAFISLGALWTIGSYYINKVFYIFSIKYLKFNLNIITNRREKND